MNHKTIQEHINLRINYLFVHWYSADSNHKLGSVEWKIYSSTSVALRIDLNRFPINSNYLAPIQNISLSDKFDVRFSVYYYETTWYYVVRKALFFLRIFRLSEEIFRFYSFRAFQTQLNSHWGNIRTYDVKKRIDSDDCPF